MRRPKRIPSPTTIEALELLLVSLLAHGFTICSRLGDTMGMIILHDTMGFLADFDPFGKQEFTWTPNAQDAWVFASHKSAMAAMRWLPRHVKQHASITKKNENMNSSSS
jgi:hypothetical protein